MHLQGSGSGSSIPNFGDGYGHEKGLGIFFKAPRWFLGASLVAHMVKSLPAMWETQVGFLGQEDPLEKEMAIHSSTLAWKIP